MVEYKQQTFRKVLFIYQLIEDCFISLFLTSACKDAYLLVRSDTMSFILLKILSSIFSKYPLIQNFQKFLLAFLYLFWTSLPKNATPTGLWAKAGSAEAGCNEWSLTQAPPTQQQVCVSKWWVW